MSNGHRYVVTALSEDYGERRYAIDDLSLTRHSLVRQWRSRGVGKVSVAGIKRPKTGLVWRGTIEEAEQLCAEMNKVAALGTIHVATDPPTRENARHWANSSKNARGKSGRKPATSSPRPAFERCDVCQKMVRQPHGH